MSQIFDEVAIPARLAFGSTGGVERKTEIVELASGHERRSTPWAMGRRRYLVGAGDGVRTAFSLCKAYGMVKLAVGGVETDGFALDTATGVVTLDVAPNEGQAVTAGFWFDTPVRFDTDRLGRRCGRA